MTPQQQTAVNNFRRHVNVLVSAMSWSSTCNGPNIGEMKATLSQFDEAAFSEALAAMRGALGCEADKTIEKANQPRSESK